MSYYTIDLLKTRPLRSFYSFLEHSLAGICLISLSLVFISLAVAIRLLPGLLVVLRHALRGLLILSYRFYQRVLTSLDGYLRPAFGIDVLSGYGRIIACVALSLTITLLVTVLIGIQALGWCVLLALLHGLFVGLAWEEIERPEGFQLGVKIQ